MVPRIKNYFQTHKPTVINYGWRGLQIISKQGITFIIFAMAAKLLTPEQFGVYNYVFAIILLLMFVSDFGFSTSACKYTAEYSQTNRNKVPYLIFNTGLIIFILSLVVIIFIVLLGKYLFSDYFTYLLYLLPLVFLTPLTSLYDGVYMGLKKFKKLSIISLLVGVFSVGIVYYFIKKYNLTGALIAQNIYYLFLLLGLIIGNRKIRLKIQGDLFKKIFKYSVYVGLANIGYFLFVRINTIVLGQFGMIEEISYYSLADKVFQLILLPILIFASVVAPNSTKRYVEKKCSLIRKKLVKYSFALFLAGVVMATIAYFASVYLFSWFLPDYNQQLLLSSLLLILILVPFRYFSGYISVGCITPTGHAKILAVTTLSCGALNLILDIVFVGAVGYYGIFYATIISQLIMIFSTAITYYVIIGKVDILNKKINTHAK